jgi:hypothetical protein
MYMKRGWIGTRQYHNKHFFFVQIPPKKWTMLCSCTFSPVCLLFY